MPKDDDRIKLQPNDILVLDKKYIVTKTLNSGGTSVCYIVKDDNGITYVIKEYYPQNLLDRFALIRNNDGLLEFSSSTNESDRQAFTDAVNRQIIVEAQLNKIILDDGENNSRFVFAFEPIDSNAKIATQYAKVNTESGKCLSEFGGNLELGDIINILDQIVLSIHSAIHCKKYLHLDIKPDNLYWCEDRIRVLDLGASVQQGRQNFQDIMNSPGYSGTEGYCSPLLQEIYNKRQTIAEMSYFYTDEHDAQKLEELVAQLSVKDDIFSIMRCFLYLIFGCSYGVLVEKYSDLNSADELDIIRQALLDCDKIDNLYVDHIISMLQKAKNTGYDTLIESDSETCSLMADIIALREICENKGYHEEIVISKGKRFLKNIFQNRHITISNEILPFISYKSADGEEISVSSLTDVIDSFQKDNIRLFTLTANGGYGKTVTLLNYAQNCFKRCQKSEIPIPLFVSLNSVENTKHSLLEYIDNIYFSGEGHEQLQRFFETSGRNFILLLDGLNELDSNSRSNITQQILFLSKCKNLFIVISTRIDLEDFELLANFSQFQRLVLEKLNSKQIEKYVKKCNSENVSETLMQILSTPLNLTLYFQTADFWTDISSDDSKNLYYPVESPLSSGEVLLNYIYLQIYKIKSTGTEIPQYGKFGDISTMEHHICCVNFYLTKLLPYIAYTMYEKNNISITQEQTIEKLQQGLAYFESYQNILFEEFDVYQCGKWSVKSCFPSAYEDDRERCRYLFDEILIKQMGLIYKQDGKYRFFHDNILDILAMLHVTNQTWLENVPPLLYKVELNSETKKLLGEIWHEKHHIPFQNSSGEWEAPQYVDTTLNSLLDNCRNSTDAFICYAISNIIDIVLSVRGELTGLDLSYLDLRTTRLYGVICSRTGKQNSLAANFTGCKFSDSSWRNYRHSISPNYSFLRRDNKIVTVDSIGYYRVWNTIGRLLPNGYGNNVYKRVCDRVTCCVIDGNDDLVIGTADGHIVYLIDGRYKISMQKKAGIKEFIERCYISKETQSYVNNDFCWAGYVIKERPLSDHPIHSVAVSQDGKQYYFLVDGVHQGKKQRYVYHEKGRPDEPNYMSGTLWPVDERIINIELTGDEQHLLLHQDSDNIVNTQVLHLNNGRAENLPFTLNIKIHRKNYAILPKSSNLLIYNKNSIDVFNCNEMKYDKEMLTHFKTLPVLSSMECVPINEQELILKGYNNINNRQEIIRFNMYTSQITFICSDNDLSFAYIKNINHDALLLESLQPHGGNTLIINLINNTISSMILNSQLLQNLYFPHANQKELIVVDSRCTVRCFDVNDGQYLKTIYKRSSFEFPLSYHIYVQRISSFIFSNLYSSFFRQGYYSDAEFLFVSIHKHIINKMILHNNFQSDKKVRYDYCDISLNYTKTYIYAVQGYHDNYISAPILTIKDIKNNTLISYKYPNCKAIILIHGSNVVCRNFENEFDIYHPINDQRLFRISGQQVSEVLLLTDRAILWKNGNDTFFHIFKSNMISPLTWPYMSNQETKSIAYVNHISDAKYEFGIINLSSLSWMKRSFTFGSQPKIVALGEKSILFSLDSDPNTIRYINLNEDIESKVVIDRIDYWSISYHEEQDVLAVSKSDKIACFKVSTGERLYLLKNKDLEVKNCDFRECSGIDNDIRADLKDYGAIL